MTEPADVRLATQADAAALARLERESNLLALAHVFPADEHPFPTAEVEDRWRRGWGRALVERAVSRMGPQPRLWCLVDNAGARSLYERLGWRPTGREAPAEWPPHPVEIEYARTNPTTP